MLLLAIAGANQKTFVMRQLRIIRQITNREAPSLDKYLLEVGKIPLLSSDEEIYLSQRIKAGDNLALETLVKSNLRFVISVAKQYQNQGLQLIDLICEGNLGLIKASRRFDPTKGFRFISYAVWWIRQAILQALAEQARMIKLPQNKVDNINRINRAFTKLEQEFQREPTPEEIADMLGMNLIQVEQSQLTCGTGTLCSLDSQTYDEENANSLSDLLTNELTPSPDNDLIETSLKIEIERLLCKLNSREAAVLSSYYGLNGRQPSTIDDIGRTLGLTRERVRQIRDNTIKKLRNNQFLTILKPFLG